MIKTRKKVIVIVGPTASGKSDLSVSLAKKFKGEIVSADSRQVYKGLDIGTGKITKREMKGVRHHLLDVADPKKRFSAWQYQILAREAIDEIVSRGKTPIICGGTGFYIDAIFDDNAISDVPPNFKLRKKLEKKSAAQLLLVLKKLDLKRAAAISKSNSEKKNARRLIRAIEIARAKNEMYRRRSMWSIGESGAVSQGYEKPTIRREYAPFFIGIKLDKIELRKRILARLLKRLRQGMIAEARKLHASGLSWKRMDELGLEYRYLAKFLRGKMNKAELVKKLETEIWHYARRQITWWNRNKKITWFKPTDKKKIAELIGDSLAK